MNGIKYKAYRKILTRHKFIISPNEQKKKKRKVKSITIAGKKKSYRVWVLLMQL